ncbi:MAG: hypothetical protein RLZZ387_380 [Chloroflexota bacterium]
MLGVRDGERGGDRALGGRSAAIVNAQNELAFRKWRVAAEGGDPEADPLVVGWRRHIAALRGEGG